VSGEPARVGGYGAGDDAGSAQPGTNGSADNARAANEASGGYNPQPIDTSRISLPEDIQDLTELLAENTHDVRTAPARDVMDGCSHGERVEQPARQLKQV